MVIKHLWLVLLVPLRYQPLTCAKIQIKTAFPLTLRGGLSGVLDLAILLQIGIFFLHKHKFYSKIGKDYVFSVGSRHQNDACLKCLEFGRPTWGIFVFWPLGGCFPTSAFKIIELEGNFWNPPWTWAILFKAFHIYFYCLKVFFLAPNATAGRLLIFIPKRAAWLWVNGVGSGEFTGSCWWPRWLPLTPPSIHRASQSTDRKPLTAAMQTFTPPVGRQIWRCDSAGYLARRLQSQLSPHLWIRAQIQAQGILFQALLHQLWENGFRFRVLFMSSCCCERVGGGPHFSQLFRSS